MKSLMKSVFLLVLAGAALGEVQKRVYVDPAHPHGGAAPHDQGRHHVILYRLGCADLVRCGGSLLNQDWVLTAAHCDCSRLVAILNAHPDFLQVDVRAIAEKHLCCDDGASHDLMLLRLRSNPQAHQFPTIRLPNRTCTAPAPGQNVRFYGWTEAALGPLDPHFGNLIIPRDANNLCFGDTTVVACSQTAPNNCPVPWNFPYTPGQCVCVQRRHVAANQGDSGGSLVWNAQLYGVLSTVEIYLDQNQNSQSNFMNICNQIYRDWIFRVTGL